MITSLLSVVAALAASIVNAEASTLSIHGSGTTNPSKCYWHIMDKMEARAKLPLHMTYRAIGSSAGQAEFSQNPAITAFGSGDIPLKKEFWDAFAADGTTVLQLPVFVGAVSFFHSVPNTPTLNLTACTLAKIMKREITSWDNEEITDFNPDLTIPSGGLPIRVARRIDGSSSTSGITNFLSSACPEVWSEDNTGSTVEWPEGTLECQGSAGVSDCIAEEPGTIGYLDAGHGHADGFEEVYLENQAGTKLTTIQSGARGGIAGAALVEGLLPGSASDDFSDVTLINQPGEFTWPIAAMTYVYVRQDLFFMSNPQEQALLKAFLQTLYDDSFVQQCVDAYEFSKVDGAALQIALDAIDALVVNASSTPFQFEEGTMLNEAQGDYFISAKRRSANEVEIDVLTTANAALKADITELTRMMAQTNQQVASLSSAVSGMSRGGDTNTEAVNNGVFEDGIPPSSGFNNGAMAALATSIVSLVVSAMI